MSLATVATAGSDRPLRFAATGSRPLHQRRQRGEDRLDVAAGLQPEHRAAIVEQVELDVAAAADELLLAVGLVPTQRKIASHQLGIDLQEGPADILRESEGCVPPPVDLRRG